MPVISCIIFISQESLTRMHKRIYWHMYKSLKHIYISVAFTCSFIIIIQMAQFMFFALNQRVLDWTTNEWHEKFNFCESMRQHFLCRIFHVLKYKWWSSLLLQASFSCTTTRITFSSCQSKAALWWVEWSRLVKNGDLFYSHFEDELSTCFVHACLVYLIRFFICVEIA